MVIAISLNNAICVLGDSKELQEEKGDPMEIEKPFTPTPSISEQQPFKTEGKPYQARSFSNIIFSALHP